MHYGNLSAMQLDLSELRLRHANMAGELQESNRRHLEERNQTSQRIERLQELQESNRRHLEEINRMSQQIERLQEMLARALVNPDSVIG